jgi:hypothetical protein
MVIHFFFHIIFDSIISILLFLERLLAFLSLILQLLVGLTEWLLFQGSPVAFLRKRLRIVTKRLKGVSPGQLAGYDHL